MCESEDFSWKPERLGYCLRVAESNANQTNQTETTMKTLTRTKLADLSSVTIINPWSGASCQEMTWAQIRKWATNSIHHASRREWLAAAREAFRDQDGNTLGTMIIGS